MTQLSKNLAFQVPEIGSGFPAPQVKTQLYGQTRDFEKIYSAARDRNRFQHSNVQKSVTDHNQEAHQSAKYQRSNETRQPYQVDEEKFNRNVADSKAISERADAPSSQPEMKKELELNKEVEPVVEEKLSETEGLSTQINMVAPDSNTGNQISFAMAMVAAITEGISADQLLTGENLTASGQGSLKVESLSGLPEGETGLLTAQPMAAQVAQFDQTIQKSSVTGINEAIDSAEQQVLALNMNGLPVQPLKTVKTNGNSQTPVVQTGEQAQAFPGVSKPVVPNQATGELSALSTLPGSNNSGNRKVELTEVTVRASQKAGDFESLQSMLINSETNEEGKPLNLAVIQTQLKVGENSAKTEPSLPLPNVQAQQQPVTQSQISETVGTGSTAGPNKEELFSQIIERAKIMLSNNHSEMEVSLKPDHLGKIYLKVAVENQIVTAQFVAESQQVKQILESNLSDLRNQLQDSGVQVDSLMVSVGEHQGRNFDETLADRGELNFAGNANSGRFQEDESGSESEPGLVKSLRNTIIDMIA